MCLVSIAIKPSSLLKSHHAFTKSELILKNAIITVDLPDEIVRCLGETVRGLLKDGRVRDAR